MSNANSLERQLLIQQGLSAWLNAWKPVHAHNDMKHHGSFNRKEKPLGSNTMFREEIHGTLAQVITGMVKGLLQEQE